MTTPKLYVVAYYWPGERSSWYNIYPRRQQAIEFGIELEKRGLKRQKGDAVLGAEPGHYIISADTEFSTGA